MSDQITLLVQRQVEDEEEDELIQTKALGGTDDFALQRQPEEEEEELLQTKQSAGHTPEVTPHLASAIASMQGGGQPLPASERAFFEPRFGQDFSQVRLHTDQLAAEAARAVNARAFTLGSNVFFGAGQFAPAGHEGKGLLAHELTHVVQQGHGGHCLQFDLVDDLKKAADKKAEEFAKQELGKLADAPVGPPSGFSGDPKCGPTFCQPFISKVFALKNLAWAGPLILAGIAKKVNTRIVPLWATYLSGGSPPKNLTADFGKDFTASQTTADTTRFLIGELRKDIEANQAALLGGAPIVTVDFTPRLSSALAAIDDPVGLKQMNFNHPFDIAGNLAGGIGKDQTLFPIGAQPSPHNDSREASVKATMIRIPGGSVIVVPAIRYTVKDTIDLCPGDCGLPNEMVATVPLSRYEATGVAGDVPLIIEFDAPAAELIPFLVLPQSVPGTVKASALNIRSAPSTSAAIVGSYPKGTAISILCQTTGTMVDGNNQWYQTDKGFVSARYVTLTGSAPAVC